tara:strand:- start:17 stop:862 length:846 start_codon:yes stop_codon:yes gene_type:complete
MKIGIVGFGFVGKAIKNGLLGSVEAYIVDPKLSTEIGDLIDFSPKIIFLCLPTPMNKDGDQDISILQSVIDEINSNENLSKVTLVLKSTVIPSKLHQITDSVNLIVNPEFLREISADKDFIDSEFILLGGPEDRCKKVKNFYLNHTKCKTNNFIITDKSTALLMKYTINTFLATKVTFFNEIYKIHSESNNNESWDSFIKMVSCDKRIGESHMQVPGPDGRKGFGGACFPKDISALMHYAESLGLEFDLLKKIIQTNNRIRLDYDSLTEREEEQSVSFKDT